ncbi:hypothetical protein GCM10009546_73720 [Actinomadura livida]|uniref:Twin-arginine translocation signal domain-containing protein n=1 Tax=Actinomadura livida TaxID=79909 RepID=A0A7W7IH74_9ACTN|nr:hypothetical protein [Actinomadura catellatispora]GGU36899.1 hypothetical protein GCM10010208_71710 [Actinomadura livida]
MLHLSGKGSTGMNGKKPTALTRQRMLAPAGAAAAAAGLAMAGPASADLHTPPAQDAARNQAEEPGVAGVVSVALVSPACVPDARQPGPALK